MTTTATKTYVLDTSVLLSDPSALFAFAEHEVVLPIVVIKELEAKRHDPVLGFNARRALHHLEDLRGGHDTDLRKGVTVNDDNGTVRIEINHVDTSHLPDAIRRDSSNDTRILSVADALRREGKTVVVVSKDLPLRVLAHGALGIPAEEYRREQVPDSGYTGLVEIDVTQADLDELYEHKRIPLDRVDVPVNTGTILTAAPSGSALARVNADKELVLVRQDLEAFGVRGRSAEQRIALAHLLDPDVPVVSLGGKAGTGKSVLALAAALEMVLERRSQQRILVFRPIYSVGGQDLGFLPGSAAEKMDPWGAAVIDALKAFTTDEVVDEVLSRGLLEVLPLTHIRGRTLANSVVLLDESQNHERQVLLTALSRTGQNSKVILTWDAAQRDNLRVGRHDGIAAVVERLKGEPLFAHVTLTRSERSPVAAMATRLLDSM